ncbi:MAG: DUF5615 family PIN-like protein [Cyclobacteriaceae bacterium]|nr:DUF5615 family PIN-like protein [Cyclobacteriaceae bacterium]
MRFLADMGISMTTVTWLRSQGYDAVHLSEQKLTRLNDELILEKAKAEDRILLTCDLDFGFLLSVSKESAPSTVIFRLEFQTPLNHIHKLKQLINDSMVSLQKGSIVSVDDKRIRIRSLPIK